jgi:heme-degrading monooxygenase HmoA
MVVYTLGIWTVKAGQESEFVEAWRDMAERTAAEFPAPSATLLQDRDRSNVFISYGPWGSLEDIANWRGSATFEQGVARIRSALESFEPHTMDPVASIGD